MMLERFFDYYLNHTAPEIAERILTLLPSNLEKTPDNLAAMFRQSSREAFEFQVAFFETMADIRREDPAHCIMFDDSTNTCYPFFIECAWERLPPAAKAKARNRFGVSGAEELIPLLIAQPEARSWFRLNLAGELNQRDLFAFNEVIALINFSSGGEYSFLNLVYPRVKDLKGKALDAGCGAGFASLLMSRHLEVTGIDACGPRLNRARGMARMLQEGKGSFLSRVIGLIETEMGEIFGGNQALVREGILEGHRKQPTFIQGSLDSLGFPDEEFDVVVCLDVLEHTYEPSRVIGEFARVTRPGALIFVTVPNANGELYQRLQEESSGATFPAMLHLHHWEPASLAGLFQDHGLETVEMKLFDYLPAEALGRLSEADRAKLIADDSGYPLQVFTVFRKA
ncbi:MAG: class I SAM-dependent methyltransferase [Syntrophomonadaceae bacterium]|nr:class I SAM-dependent methyltransferase [Syntrophomonadaceae bacterium]